MMQQKEIDWIKYGIDPYKVVERWKESDLQTAIDLDKKVRVGQNVRINFQEEGK